ncbi:hypothetical protein Ct61P_09933 [Colletotrichum tofieldiae]|nr:hypothetical protein Ct61P_09933 [Colletotrichum tofieldiae]
MQSLSAWASRDQEHDEQLEHTSPKNRFIGINQAWSVAPASHRDWQFLAPRNKSDGAASRGIELSFRAIVSGQMTNSILESLYLKVVRIEALPPTVMS